MKILALVNAHALAHVSRVLEVAKLLRQRDHEILFAGHGQYLGIAATGGFETKELPFVPIDQVVEAIRSQKLGNLFKKKQLAEYVHAELELYAQINPDLLLIDNRLTATTSAELAGIRTASILNVHMSLHKTIPFYSIRNLFNLGPNPLVRLVDSLENRIESLFYDRVVMKDMNRLRLEYGLPKKHGYRLEEGDLTMFPDIPEFSPVRSLPKGAHYIGPLTWRNDLPAPACMTRLDPQKKIVYFTIGSAGIDNLIEQMGIFSKQPVQIVIATGELTRSIDAKLPDNVFLEKYVNADTLLPHCDLVVCHGGNGTIYQALSHGLPIVGMATHEEQHYGLKRVIQLKLGVGFSRNEIRKHGLKLALHAVEKVLDDNTYKQAAERFQRLLSAWNGPEGAADLIERFALSKRNA